MSLLKERSYYKPFQYPWAFEAYDQQQKMHWLPSEVPLACLLYTSPSPRD